MRILSRASSWTDVFQGSEGSIPKEEVRRGAEGPKYSLFHVFDSHVRESSLKLPNMQATERRLIQKEREASSTKCFS